jgi:hypothetical protein
MRDVWGTAVFFFIKIHPTPRNKSGKKNERQKGRTESMITSRMGITTLGIGLEQDRNRIDFESHSHDLPVCQKNRTKEDSSHSTKERMLVK